MGRMPETVSVTGEAGAQEYQTLIIKNIARGKLGFEVDRE
jgi:hypothetical protein